MEIRCSNAGFLPYDGPPLLLTGPLLFLAFGVGAGLASTFEPLRPLFTVLTAGFLALGFYSVYGRREMAEAKCAPGEACSVPKSATRDKVLLWAATVLAVGLWSFTYWSNLLV